MRPHTVLVVEDRPSIAAHLEKAILATEGLSHVGTVGTVDQGVDLLYTRKPRLVLVDLGLPDGSGLEIVRACTAADWNVDSLVVSIFGDEDRVVDAIQAGAAGYVLKGGDLGTIGADIQSVLDGGSPISPAIARHLLGVFKRRVVPSGEALRSDLSDREVEILRAVSRGFKRHEIAQQLGITSGTVGNHITRIYRKLEVSSNIEAVVHAAKIGVI
ncbi:response regulator transcription factor [Planktotalea sp.]|uniref:response regulator transcription factor n=1 Tax=Planktotalea sp. TaxID=2029877 RepID=UPI003299A67D